MPRPIERVARGLLRVAEHDVIKLLRINGRAVTSRSCNRRLPRNRAQFLRRIVFDFSAIAPKGRARPADDGDVSRF